MLPAEGTAWIKARHVCDHCSSDGQPPSVPGQQGHFTCVLIYVFSVHVAFISAVMTPVHPFLSLTLGRCQELRVCRETLSPSLRVSIPLLLTEVRGHAPFKKPVIKYVVEQGIPLLGSSFSTLDSSGLSQSSDYDRIYTWSILPEIRRTNDRNIKGEERAQIRHVRVQTCRTQLGAPHVTTRHSLALPTTKLPLDAVTFDAFTLRHCCGS